MRILQVLRAPVGGLFRHVSDLTTALAARGHEVGLVVDSLTTDALSAQRLAALEPSAALSIHSVPMPRVIGLGDFTAPLRIRALAQRLGVEIVHGHGAKGGLNARFARAGVKGRAALYTPHGGVLNYKPRSPVGKAFRQFERLMVPQTDAIIFESAFARDAYFRTIARPRCPTPVIHNGLAAREFDPIPLAGDARDFVFIGEFRDVKGIDVMLDALAGVGAANGRPATLIAAGSGPDLPKVEAQIARLGLKDRVTLAGVQPARAMLALGRCCLVPSRAESLPYVILEAAAAGRPVIATRVGGIAEIFGPTAESLLPAGDVPALRGAMQQSIDNPGAGEQEAKIRLDFIATRFSLDHMVDQIEALYREVLARR